MNVVKESDTKLLVLIVLAASLAGALWYFRNDILPPADERVVVQPEPVVEEVPVQSGQIHPLAPSGPSEPFEDDLVPLPPLDDSDGYFLLALIDILGPDV